MLDLLFADSDMDDEEDNAQDNADGANNKVGNAEERVLAAHPRRCCQYHTFRAIKTSHREVCTGLRPIQQ